MAIEDKLAAMRAAPELAHIREQAEALRKRAELQRGGPLPAPAHKGYDLSARPPGAEPPQICRHKPRGSR